MRAVGITAMGNGFKPVSKERLEYLKDTAYFIFDKNEVHLFSVDAAHFRAMNNRMSDPVIGAMNEDDINMAAREMISTGGTIWQITQQFIEGADISFQNPAIPAKIYKRILNHLDRHLNEMRTNLRYSAPDMEDFRNLAEFATAIRTVAIMHDPELDTGVRENAMSNFLNTRPVFRLADKHQANKAPEQPKAPKSVRTMDAIERMMELTNGS